MKKIIVTIKLEIFDDWDNDDIERLANILRNQALITGGKKVSVKAEAEK